jgi:hypothetical protein
MTVVVLLLVFLFGFSLYRLSPVLAGVFYLLVSLLLGFLAARGRYDFPSLRQYLVSMIIALVPIVGTIYSAVFTARYAEHQRTLRLSLLVALMLSLLLALFIGTNLGERFNLGDLSARLPISPTAEETLEATPKPSTATAKSTGGGATEGGSPTSPAPESASTEDAQPSATPRPPQVGDECLPWDQVNMDMVGQKLCVYGDYLEYYQKGDGSWVLVFSQDPGTFQVWSSAKRPMELLVPRDGSTCVEARGWLQTSGVRPIIIVNPVDIGPCP